MPPTKEYRLLCLENPLLDIQAPGTPELLAKYGLKPNDAILATPAHAPLFDELLARPGATLLAGGAAQNTARAAQYLLPPASVVFVGGVGADRYADILRAAVARAGLRVEYRVAPRPPPPAEGSAAGAPTGRCGVVITGHSRSMCTDLGAASHYGLDHLQRPDVWRLVEGAEVFYVGGYHLTVCPPAIMALAKEAAAKNKIFMLSLSAPFIPQFFKEPLDASAPYWDYVIGNEDEAAAWAAAQGHQTTDLKAIARLMANLPKENAQRKRVAIITHGTEPTLVATQGEEEVKEYPVLEIDKSLINDTNGAGDAFAGGLAAGIVEGKSLDESIHQGQWLAKLSIQELGPSFPFPKKTYEPGSH